MNKNNVIICSKNRKKENSTSSSVDVELNTPLKCGDNEYFTVGIQSFNMIKSFYALQNNLNNQFYIVVKGEGGAYNEEFIRYIPQGNYSISSLLIKLKELCFGLINVDYDKTLNKFKYTRLETSTEYNIEGYDLYIKCTNCGSILGFKDGVEYLITTTPEYSETFVNVSGYTSLIVKIGGLSMTSSYINMISSKFDISRMIGLIDVASIMPMDSIIYNGDGENSRYRISDKVITRFSIDIVNENNVIFPQMSDYIMNLVFEKHTHPTDINMLFNTFMTRFNDLMFYISYLFQYFNIGNPIQ